MASTLVLALPPARQAPKDVLAVLDTLYMSGFSLVLLVLMLGPWLILRQHRRLDA